MNRNTASTALTASTSACPALKRFIRGPLRQFGLGIASLLLVLSLTAHSLVSTDYASPENSLSETPSFTASAIDRPATESLGDRQLEKFDKSGLSQFPYRSMDTGDTGKSEVSPFRVLSSTMTKHQLTGSRLALPLTDVEESASIVKHERK